MNNLRSTFLSPTLRTPGVSPSTSGSSSSGLFCVVDRTFQTLTARPTLAIRESERRERSSQKPRLLSRGRNRGGRRGRRRRDDDLLAGRTAHLLAQELRAHPHQLMTVAALEIDGLHARSRLRDWGVGRS